MKVTKPNSPESFEICRRVGEEDRRLHGEGRKFGKPEKKYKPSNEWKPRVKITPEIIGQVYQLIDEGKTLPEIAEAVNISRITAARIKRRKHEHS